MEKEGTPTGKHVIQTIPIYIGVTGHKDIPEETVPNLKATVRAVIQYLHDTYQNTPLTVISSLAEGADTLVAEVGLEAGCGLIAVLPMPREEYERDFPSDTARHGFRSLLDKAEAVFTMPYAKGSTADSIRHPGEHRDRQYAAAGNFVAAHSQVLLALWNGIEMQGPAGTSAVVRTKLSGNFDQATCKPDPFFVPDSGPVYYIFTRRRTKDAGIVTKPPKPAGMDWFEDKGEHTITGVDVLYPAFWNNQETGEKGRITPRAYYAEILHKIDAFNADAKSLCRSDEVQTSRQSLLPAEHANGLPRGMAAICNLYGTADVLAQRFKAESLRALKILLAGAVVGFSFLSIFSELLATVYILALFPATLGMLFLYWRHTEKKEIKDKFNDYRALAEALRVQFFWKLLGSRESVTDHYLRKFKREMGWILHAVRNVSIEANHACRTARPPDRNASFELAMRHWVEDQRAYFEKKCREKQENIEKQQAFTLRLFVLAMLLVAALFAIKGVFVFVLGHADDPLGMEDVKEWLIGASLFVSIEVLLATGAARAAYVEKSGLLEEVKQFQRMLSLYKRAHRTIRERLAAGGPDKAEELLIELGREALTESGDWLLLQRSKPLEMPMEG